MNIHIELRSAIVRACQYRGDSAEHQAACLRETLEQPEEDLDWWLWYWRNQAGATGNYVPNAPEQ